MTQDAETVLVAGGGGFLGGHLVADLLSRGARVRAVDIKPLDQWYQQHETADNRVLDLRDPGQCATATNGVARVFNLACDMGGMGFIELNKALCMRSVLINTHLLHAALEAGVTRYFFASSACVYKAENQSNPDCAGLREDDVYPAAPEDGYGWEKLFGERMCRHYREDFGLETRVARLHGVYGPHGTFDGGREKAPAAICRKVAQAVLSGSGDIEIWGDGSQTRSFMFVDDFIEGLWRLEATEYSDPVNLGSAHMVSINELVDSVEEIAGTHLTRRYNLDAPKGVAGRNSDNTLIKSLTGWEPSTPLTDGLEITYRWIHDQIAAKT